MLHSDGEKFFEPHASLKDGRLLLAESCRSSWPGFNRPIVWHREKLPFNSVKCPLSTPKLPLG
ncbi:MAG: hypothetical protein AMS22_00630 [Thiotrichales bacterium SG8_50]|nr:MAG: hypothetical protein AMS22_00630 [Thiotrichales bacterium SG8_50]